MPTAYICATCGTQYAPSDVPPQHCAICEDERQYVGLSGQNWTTLDTLRKQYRNTFFQEGPELWGIGMEPKFAIGQRALLLRSAGYNVLWDCVSLIDSDTVEIVRSFGGIDAIAISHPHYYTTMIEWSRAFDNAPIYVHQDDRQWVERPDPLIHFWRGEEYILRDGISLIRVGGHFAGGQVLHWAGAGDGGALLTGDMPQVCPDRRWVSFMYSYPNFLPVDAATVRTIVAKLEKYNFAKIYGAWPKLTVEDDAKEALLRSAERYLKAMGEAPPAAMAGGAYPG